jgi:hypothetical protein
MGAVGYDVNSLRIRIPVLICYRVELLGRFLLGVPEGQTSESVSKVGVLGCGFSDF